VLRICYFRVDKKNKSLAEVQRIQRRKKKKETLALENIALLDSKSDRDPNGGSANISWRRK
jgi:hypothetical protein